MAKKSVKQLIAAGDRATIKKAMNTPAWRHLLTSEQVQKYKSFNPKAAQLRATKDRLAAPITQGSTTTERDLAHEAEANLNVEYGPQEADLRNRLGVAQQRERDIGGFYDQYLSELQHNQQNVAAAGQTAATGLAQTQAGITGLSAANLTQLQNPAVQDAQARGATAGDLSQMASNAAATRQALFGSFQAQNDLQSAAANRYAGGLASVVGPGQKLQAQAQQAGKTEDVRKLQSDLTARRGAADVKFRSERRADEAKNVLAESIATNKTKADLAQANLQSKTTLAVAGIGAKTAANKIAADATQKQADRDAKIAADANKAHKPNEFGVPTDQWATWSTSHRTRFIKNFRDKTGKTKSDTAAKQFEDKYGVKPVTTQQANQAKGDISTANIWLKRITESGEPIDKAGQILTTGRAKGKSADEPEIPRLNPVLIRAAMDMRQHGGYISAGTAARLHRAGYSVATLGLKTRPPTGRGYTPPASARGQ